MKYLHFRSRAEFYRTDVPETFFTHALKLHECGGNWKDIKPLIMHKDCPDYVRQPFTKSDKWFIRLTAMLNKYSWKKYAVEALNDVKSTVRAAAIKRLLYNENESPKTRKELLTMVVNDKMLHSYFDLSKVQDDLIEINNKG